MSFYIDSGLISNLENFNLFISPIKPVLNVILNNSVYEYP